MKKGIFVRIFVGLTVGIAISYLITIIISAAIGDGMYYPCVPSLVERYQNELVAVIVQTIKCCSWSRLFRCVIDMGEG